MEIIQPSGNPYFKQIQDLDELLHRREVIYRQHHIFISDTLRDLATFLFPERTTEINYAYELSKLVELSFWATDNIVDNEHYPKIERYLDLIVIYESLMRFFEKISSNTTLYADKHKKLYSVVSQKIRDLYTLLAYEKSAVEHLKCGDLRKAIDTIITGKIKNAEIYVTIFETILDSKLFRDYIPYRKLELLYKDLKDLEEDLINNNLSASTIAFMYATNTEDLKKIKEDILYLAKTYFDSIKSNYLKHKALEIYKNLEKYIEEFCSRLLKVKDKYKALDDLM